MKFKLGDKVWVQCLGGDFPKGVFAAVILGPCDLWGEPGWWNFEFEDAPSYNYPKGQSSHESKLRPRDDPTSEQEPKQTRELLGRWEDCEWSPLRYPAEEVA